MSDEQSELQRLRAEVQLLQQQLAKVSRRLDAVQTGTAPPVIVKGEPPVVKAPPVTVPPPVIPRPPPIPAAPKESFEVRLGTYWLPRIGIAVLLTGMVFFAAYVTPRLSVPQKVAMGYLTCIVLGGLGLWLEKKLPAFARILQAGSLALAYFVTYAAHFVEAFRVIESPVVALTMLSVVVVFIVGVAQERQSPTLGGMALFFGYYTSVASGVATFTLASNAVLALAAVYFLARNRWVTISYGAVLATYLTYMIWVWKLSRWGDVDHLIFDSGYLTVEDFRLRAAFLLLYWLVFVAGGLLVRRETLAVAERNGLVTLNNAFFFVLFSLLMHHTYPSMQWRFQFLFAGALLVSSSVAYQRFKPERNVMDTLFVQGMLVATLGLLSYFKGVRLVAALALESVFLLMLAQGMQSRWIAWIGRATFAVASAYAWDKYSDWDTPMIYGVAFASAAGFVCAWLENRTQKDAPVLSLSAFYFALVSTALAMAAARQQFDADAMPWVWPVGAVVIALVGVTLRTREIFWAANIPLAWAHLRFHGMLSGQNWSLAQSLALIAVTWAFGIAFWGRSRARGEDGLTLKMATNALLPYAILAVIATMTTTGEFCPARWRLAVYGAEALVLMLAGLFVREGVLVWMSLATTIVGALALLRGRPFWFVPRTVAWISTVLGCGLFVMSERLLAGKAGQLSFSDRTEKRIRLTIVVFIAALTIVALRKLAGGAYLTVSWAGLGFVLLAFGFAVKQRPYRMAGLVALGFSLLRAVFHDLAKVGTVYRILSFIGLGAILLVLAFLYTKNREKLAKWL
jgi:uncharacterized membrane protein